MKKVKIILVFFLILGFVLAGPALPAEKEKEFKAIAKMGERELTSSAMGALDKKYPGEDWGKYRFPKYVYINNAVATGYKIAVKEPQLLAKFPCYCLCDVMGHKNLHYCFLEKGVVGGNFDEHASTCNICVTEAMRGFLWQELGASEEDMLKALKEIYKD